MISDAIQFNRRLIIALLAGVIVIALLARLWMGPGEHGWIESTGPTGARDDVKQIKRVLIISVDGLRPDLLLRAKSPNIRSLMKRGSYSMWARTTEVSITLPSHMTMLTGARPEYHRIFWNGLRPFIYPEVPTIFEQAHKVNAEDGKPLTTGMVAGKIKFQEFEKPGSIDYSEVYRDGEGTDEAVGKSAAHMIRSHAPRVMFVHLPNVDAKGHATGWGSPQQMDAIEKADAAVGTILGALAEMGLIDTTAIILSADHGGQGSPNFGKGSHGANDPRSRHIPWIVAGPGIHKNLDLTRYGGLIINTEDTFATACTLMNLPIPEYNDGKFISQIVYRGELLEEKLAGPKVSDIEEWWKPPAYKWEPTPIPSHHN